MKLSYSDAQHTYYLDGKRCRSVTTVAKIPDDTFSLDQWRKRQVAIGLAMSPELVERVAAHFDDKDTLNRICEEAMQTAKAHEAADRGTAFHRITERVDLDQQIIETPASKAIREAWLTALDLAGLEIVPEYVERIVAYPDRLLCGKFDRIARRKIDGRYVVLDLKTGSSAVRYPHAIAVQLALYANAPVMAAPLPNSGGTTEKFEDLPELDRTVGYVVHMPTPESVEIVGIDIEAGWQIAQTICFPTLHWRKRSDLIFPLTTISTTEADDGVSGGDHVRGARSDDTTRTPASAKQTRRRARAALEQPGTPENHAVPAEHRYSWLRARLQHIAKHDLDTGVMAEIAANWPAGVPTLKQPGQTDEQFDRIMELFDAAEAKHSVPFGPRLADFIPAEPIYKILEAFPGSTIDLGTVRAA